MSIVHLMDGRRLAYSDVGPAEGFPVLDLHGAIGSPMRWTHDLLEVIEQLGVRILAPQRPGFGLSDPHRGGSLPLRAICAAPRATTRLGDATVALVARHPKLLLRAMTIGAPPADRSHTADGATSLAAVDAFLEATGGGIAGLVDDHLVTSRPWGFELGDVGAEVHLWHGMGDAFVPVEHALQLAAALPRCRVSLDPGEGHFFFRRRVRPILTALAATRSVRLAPPAVRS